MKIETKFKYKGEPVIVTGGHFATDQYITVPLAVQARITYQNGDTGYVPFDQLENTDPRSVIFKANAKLRHSHPEQPTT